VPTITTPALDGIRAALDNDPLYAVVDGGSPSPYDEQGLTLVQDGIPQPGGWLLDVWSYGTDLAGVLYRPSYPRAPLTTQVQATYTATLP
jgi:hypothetical protein